MDGYGSPTISKSHVILFEVFLPWLRLLNRVCQAAVVGTTAVYNVIDMLEKRVLSRISHRQVVLHTAPLLLRASGPTADPGSSALAVLSDMLHLPLQGGGTPAHGQYAAGWNRSLRAALDDPATLEQLRAHLMAAPGSQANPSASLSTRPSIRAILIYSGNLASTRALSCPALMQ